MKNVKKIYMLFSCFLVGINENTNDAYCVCIQCEYALDVIINTCLWKYFNQNKLHH